MLSSIAAAKNTSSCLLAFHLVAQLPPSSAPSSWGGRVVMGVFGVCMCTDGATAWRAVTGMWLVGLCGTCRGEGGCCSGRGEDGR